MKHKVTFEYEDITFGFEGEEVIYTASSTRYFDDWDSYQLFLQEFDMAGTSDMKIVEDIECSNFKAAACDLMARVLYYAQAWRTRIGAKAFYSLMHAGLVNTGKSDLCYKFDEKHIGRLLKKGVM